MCVTSSDLINFIELDSKDSPKGRTAEAVARHFGLELVSTLGVGSQGEAYLMSDGRVIKVTGDKTEYYSSRDIVGKEIPHVNIIHRCLPVKFEGVNRYCIIQKYVSQDKREEIREFEEDTSAAYIVENYCRGYSDWQDTLDFAEGVREDATEDQEWLVDQYIKVAKHLREDANYTGGDFFYRNTGWDEDRKQVVMIDLGYSNTEIPEVEDEPIEL